MEIMNYQQIKDFVELLDKQGSTYGNQLHQLYHTYNSLNLQPREIQTTCSTCVMRVMSRLKIWIEENKPLYKEEEIWEAAEVMSQSTTKEPIPEELKPIVKKPINKRVAKKTTKKTKK